MPRIVIIGAGLMGRHHALTAKRLGAEVVGVVDADPGALVRFAATFPSARTSASLADMQAALPFDMAHICTPLPTHLPIALALAEAGIHAVVEKPVADSAADTRQIADAFARSRVFFCPVHQYAFQRGVEDAIGRMPALGVLRRIDFEIASAGGGADRAYFDRVAGEILPHPLSILQRLRPGLMLADVAWHIIRSDAGEWLIAARDGSVIVTIGISLSARPTRFSTRIAGSGGTIEVNNFHGYAVALSGVVSRAAKVAEPFERAGKHLGKAFLNLSARAVRREPAYPGLREVIARFYEAMVRRDETLLPISPEQAIDVAAARDSILAAIGREQP